VDLVSPGQAAAAEAQIRRINATAAVVRTQRSSIDLSQLLSRRNYLMRDPRDLETALPGSSLQGLLQQPAVQGSRQERQHGHQHGGEEGHTCDDRCGHEHAGHEQGPAQYHDAEVATVSLRSSRPVALEALRSWLDQLLWERQEGGPDVYRMKGVLLVEGDTRCHMLQVVYELYDIVAGPSWQQQQQQQQGGASAAAETRIVVIGRRLDRQQLQLQLDSACDAAAAAARAS
jgi:G3E family GTPase